MAEYSEQIKQLNKRLEQFKQQYFNEKGRMEQLEIRKKNLEELSQRILDNMDVLEKVRLLLQNVSEYTREQSRAQIEKLVTHCLQFIFDTGIEFKIELTEARGRAEAEFYVITNIDGEVIKTKPQEARGGGVVDIISLAVRIAMMQCSNLDVNGPLILDEPAKHVSEEYIIQVAEFLKQISTMFDRQVIIVTHNRHLSEIADKWHKVFLAAGVSKIESVT